MFTTAMNGLDTDQRVSDQDMGRQQSEVESLRELNSGLQDCKENQNREASGQGGFQKLVCNREKGKINCNRHVKGLEKVSLSLSFLLFLDIFFVLRKGHLILVDIKTISEALYESVCCETLQSLFSTLCTVRVEKSESSVCWHCFSSFSQETVTFFFFF